MTASRIHELDGGRFEAVMLLTVRADLQAPALARAFVRSGVEVLGSHAPEDAVLLTSEAVTNSVVHAHTAAVEVSLQRHGDAVRVSVTDEDPGAPEVQSDDPLRIGGHGVRLIAQLADEWGIDPIEGDGKCVWFEVALPASAPRVR